MEITIKAELAETLTRVASEQGFAEADFVQKIVDDFLTVQYKDELIKDIQEQPVEDIAMNQAALASATIIK